MSTPKMDAERICLSTSSSMPRSPSSMFDPTDSASVLYEIVGLLGLSRLSGESSSMSSSSALLLGIDPLGDKSNLCGPLCNSGASSKSPNSSATSSSFSIVCSAAAVSGIGSSTIFCSSFALSISAWPISATFVSNLSLARFSLTCPSGVFSSCSSIHFLHASV